jgi:hypothetical protein
VTPECLPDRLGAVQSPHRGTNPSATGNYAKEYYVDYPATGPLVRIIAVSPGVRFARGGRYDYSIGSPRYHWVSDRIDEARARGIRWVIVANHKQYISAGEKTDEIGSDFFNLLVSKRVDLVLQGHDHNYQRSRQLSHGPDCPVISGADPANPACISGSGADGRYARGDGPVLVINGSGGVGHYATSPADPQAAYFARVMGNTTGLTGERTSGFLQVSVSEPELRGRFVRSSGGAFSDSFTIGAPARG